MKIDVTNKQIEILKFNGFGGATEITIDDINYNVLSTGQDSDYEGYMSFKPAIVEKEGKEYVLSRNLCSEERTTQELMKEVKKVVDKIIELNDEKLTTCFIQETGLSEKFLTKPFDEALEIKDNDYESFLHASLFDLPEEKEPIQKIFNNSGYKTIFRIGFDILEEKEDIENYTDFCQLIFSKTEDYPSNLDNLVKDLKNGLVNEFDEIEEILIGESEMYGETKEDYFHKTKWSSFKGEDNMESESKILISNAFSLQMLPADAIAGTINFEIISEDEFNSIKDDAVSCVGHQDTANVLGVECNRMNITLTKEDVLIVAQLTGGRLPEGATNLPDGFSFKYMRITLGW